jgi:hypothetical protein
LPGDVHLPAWEREAFELAAAQPMPGFRFATYRRRQDAPRAAASAAFSTPRSPT